MSGALTNSRGLWSVCLRKSWFEIQQAHWLALLDLPIGEDGHHAELVERRLWSFQAKRELFAPLYPNRTP